MFNYVKTQGEIGESDLFFVVEKRLKIGHLERARQIASRMADCDRDSRIAACRAVAKAWAQGGDYADLLGWVESLEEADPELACYIYLGAAEGLVEAKKAKGEEKQEDKKLV